MAITMLEVVAQVLGRDLEIESEFSAGDFEQAGRPMLGGCQSCGATIAAYNMFPTRTGFTSCADCLLDGQGFETVEDLLTWEATR